MKRAIAAFALAGAVALGAAAPAQAITNGTSAFDGVCAQLRDHNSADGVFIVVLQLKGQGYSNQQIVNLVVGAVKTTCPQYKAAVLAFAEKYGN